MFKELFSLRIVWNAGRDKGGEIVPGYVRIIKTG
jgi:hypothetical protein